MSTNDGLPTVSSQPRPRPTSNADLGFQRRKAVRWFDPPALLRAGAKVALSGALGNYLDKRELQATSPASVIDDFAGNGPNTEELWVDFLADTGDGFNPTYTVAWQVSQPTLTVNGRELSRGSLLVLGGDEVYPTASPEEYENRCLGPFRAALPFTEPDVDGRHPALLAVPGNHDWYDGLTSFVRMFTQQRWIGGRRTLQTRSYFAVRLPHRCWLWGVDIESEAYLDSTQISYFRAAAEHMRADDRLILCTAKPCWTERVPSGRARNLAFVERELVPPGVKIVLTLTGDSHHYVRYESPDATSHKVTAGGGGAFLSATHVLPKTVDVLDHQAAPGIGATGMGGTGIGATLKREYEQRVVYPTASRSRRLSFRAALIGLRNRRFAAVPAVVGWLLFSASVSGLRLGDQRSMKEASVDWGLFDLLLGDLRSPQTALTIGLLAVALILFAKPRPLEQKSTAIAARVAMGLLHAVMQVFAAAGVSVQALRLAGGLPEGRVFDVGAALLAAGLSAIVGSMVMGLYLVLFVLFGHHDNEAFSAFRHEGYKNFLRMRIHRDGIEVFAIGIERTVSSWAFNGSATDPSASWMRPIAVPTLQLIDHFTAS